VASSSLVKRTMGFLLGWTALSVVFNLRYPAHEAWWIPLLPSVDATLLLAACAIAAYAGRRLPAALIAAAAVVAAIVRVFRVGDGITTRYFNRPLELALDLPTAPELPRLLGSTTPRATLIAGTAAACLLLVGIGLLVAAILRRAERYFADRRGRIIFAAAAAATLAISAAVPRDGHGLRAGAFGPSIVPVAIAQARGYTTLARRRADALAEVRRSDDGLRRAAGGLPRLRGANLFLFVVESYGETVLERPDLARDIEPVYEASARALAAAGFDVASGLLSSPTYAGRSHLAQETLATGVRAADPVIDAVVQRERPTTMARIFHDAGYRTVLAQPGSTHRGLYRWVYDFQQVYSAWDLDYQGPSYRWAPMPDQYTIDFIHRHEVARAAGPLLVEYALVSSHSPWSDLPPVVADWDTIGDGRIFDGLPAAHYPIGWTNLADGAGAYLRAVSYDLRIITDYIARSVPGDSLVIVLGDHQPVADVTRGSPSHAVPVHVISRNRALVDAFRARGYRSGMHPAHAGDPPGLEALLPDLLADLSEGGGVLAAGPGASVEIWSVDWTTMWSATVQADFMEMRSGTRSAVLRDPVLANRLLLRIKAAKGLPRTPGPGWDDLRRLAVIKAADGSVLGRIGVPRFCGSLHIDGPDGARYARFDPELLALMTGPLSPDERMMMPEACRHSGDPAGPPR
jgi:hypothetical protein